MISLLKGPLWGALTGGGIAAFSKVAGQNSHTELLLGLLATLSAIIVAAIASFTQVYLSRRIVENDGSRAIQALIEETKRKELVIKTQADTIQTLSEANEALTDAMAANETTKKASGISARATDEASN
jgi:hypothetical protein